MSDLDELEEIASQNDMHGDHRGRAGRKRSKFPSSFSPHTWSLGRSVRGYEIGRRKNPAPITLVKTK